MKEYKKSSKQIQKKLVRNIGGKNVYMKLTSAQWNMDTLIMSLASDLDPEKRMLPLRTCILMFLIRH